jgi:ABC-type oligopeptide transport system substrate-binding subunit
MDAVCNSINRTLDKNDACSVNPVPTFGEFRKDIAGKKLKSMFRTGWQMDYPLIQNFMQPLYYTGASSNDAGYSDKRVDKLIDEANAAGEEEAVAKFQKAESMVLDDLPAIPLWYQDGNAGYSQRVSDVRLNPFSVPVFTDIRVK